MSGLFLTLKSFTDDYSKLRLSYVSYPLMVQDLFSFQALSIHFFSGKPLVFLCFVSSLNNGRCDNSLITYSTSMERWKFAYLLQGTCKGVTGILNKKAMELEFRKLPVKPVYSPISGISYSNNCFFLCVAVGNVHDHVINFKYGFFLPFLRTTNLPSKG